MARVIEDLEDAKAEIEKLKEEYRLKAEQSENLKRAYNDQIIKIQEMNSKFQKQNQELIEKADEVLVFKKMYEDLECTLKEKVDIIKRLSYQNDKLRVESQEKITKCEEEKRELVFAMEEENEKNLEKEEKIRTLKEENEFLKRRILELQKAGVEAKERAKASKELRVRDEMLVKFEEEKKKIEEELKWKKEKFEHLKEAHEKLLQDLMSKEREWEKERCNLIDEISLIQTKLDSQIKVSADLKSWLEMCKQALAHEESKRRNLEVKVLKSTTSFDNVFAEYEDVKSNLESLIGQRDKEIAGLKDLMGTKERDYKEMEYRVKKVEKENEELKISIKELQEDRIQEARACTSMYKPRSKNVHKECLKKLEAKEAELGSQMEKMRDELSFCRLELKGKDEFIEELKQELGKMDSFITELLMNNEESSVTALVLKSFLLETQIPIKELQEDLIQEARDCTSMYKPRSKNVHKECLQKLEAKEAELGSQMEKMRDELGSCRLELKGKDEFIEELKQELGKMDSFVMELLMKNEESSVRALVLRSFLLETQMNFRNENSHLISLFKNKYKQACDALDIANDELALKFIEANEVEFELQIWKSIAERLKSDLEESYRMRREMEDSLLAQVTVEVNLKEENKILVDFLEHKDLKIKNLESLEMGSIYEAWEKMKTNEVMKEMEIQENLLGFQELEKELRMKEFEVKKLTHLVLELFDKMSKVCVEDSELMGELGKIVEIHDENLGEESFEPEKENAMMIRDFIAVKKLNTNSDCRSPLRALNILV